MAKKWGRRSRAKSPVVVPQAFDVESAFPPAASRQGRGRAPVSSTPLADQLGGDAPGVSEHYVVLPRSLAEDMPLPWQQQLASLLGQFHDTHRGLSWPTYRVVPSRPERLVDLDEEQLAEAGYLVELDADGELVYRDRTGRRVTDPEATVALVPCLDPIAARREAASPAGSPEPADPAPRGRARPGAAPMNIGPQPVWRTTPTTTTTNTTNTAQSRPAAPPPAPPAQPTQPTAPSPATPTPREPGAGPGQRDWFELADGADPAARAAGSAPPNPDSATEQATESPAPEFGPTGDESTEIPYRYRH
ncbi:hypothetical protein B1813_18035 [Saccharomonospora piscinae]|uniref:Uncharacterized protein n=1 Tax=Saccharomonospora piscinae TaxID=687388 RepID=A0A1V8ZZT7_SACPI|nr:hypothetical protein [Saccharomonospora piscinae]OQO90320.1 hypothetical protein B1813_18035 [Saccharomonospora piscinae]